MVVFRVGAPKKLAQAEGICLHMLRLFYSLGAKRCIREACSPSIGQETGPVRSPFGVLFWLVDFRQSISHVVQSEPSLPHGLPGLEFLAGRFRQGNELKLTIVAPFPCGQPVDRPMLAPIRRPQLGYPSVLRKTPVLVCSAGGQAIVSVQPRLHRIFKLSQPGRCALPRLPVHLALAPISLYPVGIV
ncbi:unnamed protein product [Protopolystoma xenopodis]|uniref:Uncharacterized protein n=1 Tax=Protopolystoma xenopodis TaxID=117903 RepID=A0A3S5BTJ6_9PLAT|nr:unnamed protein product [Protopolystoma xenopodis]